MAHDTPGTTTGSTAGGPTHAARSHVPPPDIGEKGAVRNGQPQVSNQRLFMQLLAFGGCQDPRALGPALERAGVAGVVYEDLNDPSGVAVLTFSDNPDHFFDKS